MLAEIPARQLTEWMAFYALEHLGEGPEDRADMRAGIVAATVANSVRSKGRAYRPDDFFPRFSERKREQSPEDLYAGMMGLARRGKRTANARTKGSDGGDAGEPGGPAPAQRPIQQAPGGDGE